MKSEAQNGRTKYAKHEQIVLKKNKRSQQKHDIDVLFEVCCHGNQA